MISDQIDNDDTESGTECFDTEEKHFDWKSNTSVVYDKVLLFHTHNSSILVLYPRLLDRRIKPKLPWIWFCK